MARRRRPLLLLSAALFFVLSAGSCALVRAAGSDRNDGDDSAFWTSRSRPVAELTSDDFDSTIARGRWFVMFYAPWCGHCKKLKPVWAQAASNLWRKMHFAKVDATKHGDLKEKYDVGGFPTLKLFEKGQLSAHQFKGERTVDGFVEFEARLSSPAVRSVRTEKELAEYCYQKTPERHPEKHPVTFIYIDPHGKDAPSNPGSASRNFQRIASELRTTHFFAASESSSVADHVSKGVASDTLPLYPWIAKIERGEAPVFFSSQTRSVGGDGAMEDEADLRAWVKENSHPVLSKLDRHNFYDVSHAGKLLVVGCIDPAKSERTPSFVLALRNVARSRGREYNFGYLDGVKWATFISQFNIETSSLPRIFVLNAEKQSFYEDSTVDEEDEIDTFLTEIAEGRAEVQYDTEWQRWYRMFMRHLPWSALALLAVIIFISLLVKLCLSADDWEEDAPGEGELDDGNEEESEKESKKDQ